MSSTSIAIGVGVSAFALINFAFLYLASGSRKQVLYTDTKDVQEGLRRVYSLAAAKRDAMVNEGDEEILSKAAIDENNQVYKGLLQKYESQLTGGSTATAVASKFAHRQQ